MKILFLSHKVPYPPNKGDRIPIFYRLQFLSKRHQVSMAFPCFYKEEIGCIDKIKDYCYSIDTTFINTRIAKMKSALALFGKKPLTLPYFYSKKLDEKIQNRLRMEKYDLIYVFSSSMAQYVINVKGVKKIMDFVDADSHKWFQYAEHTVPPLSNIYLHEWRKMTEYEKTLARTFDHTIAISENEKNLFKTFIPNINMSVVPNGVNLEYFRPSVAGYEVEKIVFLGAMDYFPNIDGVTFFYHKIFPIIRNEMPGIKFFIVGSRPTKAVMALAKYKDVTVTGFVDDVRPYLHDSSVCVVPLRIARGIQNKILEAMASGIPVVTTSKGNEGIGAAIGESILVADDPETFARDVISLMRDGEKRNRIGLNGRKFVEVHHNWDDNLAKFERILNNAEDKK